MYFPSASTNPKYLFPSFTTEYLYHTSPYLFPRTLVNSISGALDPFKNSYLSVFFKLVLNLDLRFSALSSIDSSSSTCFSGDNGLRN